MQTRKLRKLIERNPAALTLEAVKLARDAMDQMDIPAPDPYGKTPQERLKFWTQTRDRLASLIDEGSTDLQTLHNFANDMVVKYALARLADDSKAVEASNRYMAKFIHNQLTKGATP